MIEREEMTVEQACREFGFAPRSIYRYIRLGLIASHPKKEGKRMVRVYRDDICNFIDLMDRQRDIAKKYRIARKSKAYLNTQTESDVIINSIWNNILKLRKTMETEEYKKASEFMDCVDLANEVPWLTDDERGLYIGALYGAVKWGREAV